MPEVVTTESAVELNLISWPSIIIIDEFYFKFERDTLVGARSMSKGVKTSGATIDCPVHKPFCRLGIMSFFI